MVHCVSCLRQTGIALQLYLEDSDRCGPPVGNIWSCDDFYKNLALYMYRWNNIFKLLEPYTKSVDVFKCATPPSGVAAPGWQTNPTQTYYEGGKWKGCTYDTNVWYVPAGWYNVPTHGPTKYANLPCFLPPETGYPKGRPVNFNKIDYTYLNISDSSYAEVMGCISGSWYLSHTDPRFPDNGKVPGRHLDRAVILLADMHVQTIPWYEIYGL